MQVRQQDESFGGMVFGAIVFVIVGALAYAWFGMLRLGSLAFGKTTPQAIPAEDVTAGAVARQTAEAEEDLAPLDDSPQYIAARDIARISTKVGILTVRYYAQFELAHGRLKPKTKALQKLHGENIHLDDRKAASIKQAVDLFVQEVEAKFGCGETKSRSRTKSSLNEGADAGMPDFLDIPVDAYANDPPAGYADEPPPPFEEETVSVAPAPDPVVTRKRTKGKKPAVSYRGEILSVGKVPREFNGKTKLNYRVLLHDDALGAENAIWGADLQRAIEEGGFKRGQRVEIACLGETPVMVKGELKNKKLWSIELI
ncbi:hypothetical protein [Azonexus hydrophilus]|uniref:HIRAN domain-containing protein n=1 Tax=Azonexus hydrophilus TaxID=418702 RepID=A0ABZ2XLR0_9RHOO